MNDKPAPVKKSLAEINKANQAAFAAKMAAPVPVPPPAEAPVRTPNLPVKNPNPAPSTVVTNPQGNLGDITPSNVHAGTLEDTLSAAARAANLAANQAADITMQGGQQQAETIANRDAQAKANVAAREGDLDKIQQQYKADTDETRKQLDANLLEQKQIAGRAANVAAAQAGASGLQMSQGAYQDLVNDATSKYGQNIATANQFRTQTNMTINDALKSTGLDIFNKKSVLDQVTQALNKEGAEPILNALKAVTEGKAGAVKDVAALIKGFVEKKAGEEYTRTMAAENRAAQNREWTAAKSSADKISILTDYNKSLSPYADIIRKTLGNHPDWSQDEVMGEVAKQIMGDENAKTGFASYMQTKMYGGKDFKEDPFWETYGQQIATAGAKTQTDLAKTDKALEANRAIADAAYVRDNPMNLTGAQNVAYYNTLQPDVKNRLTNAFVATLKNVNPATGKLFTRGEAFEEAKKFINKNPSVTTPTKFGNEPVSNPNAYTAQNNVQFYNSLQAPGQEAKKQQFDQEFQRQFATTKDRASAFTAARNKLGL